MRRTDAANRSPELLSLRTFGRNLDFFASAMCCPYGDEGNALRLTNQAVSVSASQPIYVSHRRLFGVCRQLFEVIDQSSEILVLRWRLKASPPKNHETEAKKWVAALVNTAFS
jgi:hypothetical protein